MELKDRVDQISATIQELREASANIGNSGDGRESRRLIDSLFRTVHSFKAAASAEGLSDLSRTAHGLESLLHSLRTGLVTVDPEVLRVLDETVAALRDGSASFALRDFNRLNSHMPASDDRLPDEFAGLKAEERHRAAAAIREGADLYLMEAAFEVSNFDERFRQLKERLEETAEVISTSARMEDDQIIFQVVYASSSEKIPAHVVLQKAVLGGEAAAAVLGKQIKFIVTGDELLLDKSLAGALTDALLHLVRNAVDHGIESHGTVFIEAEANRITVIDDGRGIAPENLPFLFQPGFSTAKHVTELSGRGVGLDVVKTAVEEFGGSVSVTSKPGKGSSFTITMPNPSSDA